MTTHLLHGNAFVNHCLVPLRIKTFLNIFSPSLVFSTEVEEKKALSGIFTLTDDFIDKPKDLLVFK